MVSEWSAFRASRAGAIACTLSLSLRPHKAHPHLPIVMGRRDPHSVGVQVHVARGVGQSSLKSSLAWSGFQNQRWPPAFPPDAAIKKPDGVKPQAPDEAQDIFLGPEQLRLLARLPVEDEDRRIADRPQWVAGIDQSPAGQELAVAGEREVAHAAVIDPLPGRVMFGELAGVEPSRLLAGPVVPFDHQPAQIGRDQGAPWGVKRTR